MKVTLKQILDSQQPIARLMDLKLPPATAFRLGRIVSKLDSELSVYNDQRLKIVQEFGEPMEDGMNFKIKDENIDEFNKQMNELISVEIDVEITPISIEELSAGGNTVTARDLLAAEWLIAQ